MAEFVVERGQRFNVDGNLEGKLIVRKGGLANIGGDPLGDSAGHLRWVIPTGASQRRASLRP